MSSLDSKSDSSNTSSINFNSLSLFFSIRLANSCVSSSFLNWLEITWENPTIELSGVRISCVMLRMNEVFILLAFSALSRALRRLFSDSVNSWFLIRSNFLECFNFLFK